MKHPFAHKQTLLLLVFLCQGLTIAAGTIDTVRWINRLDSVEQFVNDNYEQEFRAIRLAHKSMELKQAYYGDRSEPYLLSLLRLSELYSQRGNEALTNQYHHMAYEPYMEKLRTDFCQLSENQKSTYWMIASAYFDKTMAIAYNQSLDPRINDGSIMAASAYNAQLLSKGLLLNLSIDIERYIKASNNEQAIQLLAQRKKILSHADISAVDSLDLQILETLRNSGQAYHIDKLSLTWKQVQQKLNEEDLAIEFFRTKEGKYGALLLKAQWKQPKIIPLNNTYRESGKVSYNLEEVAEKNRTLSYSSNSDSQWSKIMASMIWTNRMLQYFPEPGKGTVYFSADGVLLQMAVEQLPFVDYFNTSLQQKEVAVMSDVYKMVRLSSTRELVIRDTIPDNHSAVVYGGVTYNIDIEEYVAESKAYDIPMRSVRSTSNERGSIVQWLPGTLKEANTIYRILSENEIVTEKYSFAKANEESFKAQTERRRNIVHVATHGFMWPGETDPMSRCGLLMAGANIALSGHSEQLPTGVQDGILTAKEISLLDFNGCDIVVLSACETAKGDVTSEGVFGLQRAFKMAGVQTIIMSLWPVDDNATQMLMTEFYTNWIVKQLPKLEAFKSAQNTVRYAVDEDGDRMFEAPVYWAGFIMLD